MNLPFKFLPQLVLRSPLLSYREYHPHNLEALLNSDQFKLAIYLASPEFYGRLATNNFSISSLSARERVTLLKYYNRMSFRPTPFGAFSSFGTLTWGSGATNIGLTSPAGCELKLLPDQSVVESVSTALFAQNLHNAQFFSNPTLYKTNKEFRYIKTLRDALSRKASFQLESFEANRFTKNLLLFLQKKPETYAEIVSYIKTNTDCSDDDAVEYLSFLINEQIVKPTWGVTILGSDHLEKLANTQTPTLSGILKRMAGVGFPDLPAVTSLSRDWAGMFTKLEIQAPKQWFYANTMRAVTGTLDLKCQQQISDAFNCMLALSPPSQPKIMAEFIKQFKSRFDMQKVPLLQALDPETGIAYGDATSANVNNPLLQDMHRDDAGGETANISWTAAHKLLFNKWNASTHPRKEITINDDDLGDLKSDKTLPVPPSMPVMFRLYDQQIVIEAVGGASATALIGRFTLLNADVKAIASDIAQQEQQNNPQVIFAEINQLSDSHVDNINRRLPVYDYELALNAPAALPAQRQIHPDDLLLSVINDQLILESINLKKRVIPRLSSAYNYQKHELSLFRFLGDLQQHGIRTQFTPDLEGMFPGLPFYPRITYAQTILCLAKWYISESDIKTLATPAAVQQMRTQQQWPQYIALGRGDQQLVFNLDTDVETALFIDCIKGETSIKLTEQLMPYSAEITDHNKKPMVNQFIAFLVANQASYKYEPQPVTPSAFKEPREFIAGSKWIYLKIYCAPARANDLLSKKILPALQSAKTDGFISWFFIRYVDTAPHIRLRIQVSENYLGNVLVSLKSKLAADVRYQLIQEYKADVYRRELERYGADIIDDVEKAFEASSNLVINYIKQSCAPLFTYNYHSLAFVSVVEIIALFFTEPSLQMAFTQQVTQSLSLEHKDVKALKFSLDKKYRSLSTEIGDLLNQRETHYKNLKLVASAAQFKTSLAHLVTLSDNFTVERKTRLAADLIHMHLNRLFVDEQRYQELIVYHCLHKHLQATAARLAKGQ